MRNNDRHIMGKLSFHGRGLLDLSLYNLNHSLDEELNFKKKGMIGGKSYPFVEVVIGRKWKI